MIPRMFTNLRTVLLVDAATCLAMGGALILGADAIAGVTDLPPALLLYAGILLLPIAAFMAFVASSETVPPVEAWLVVVGNAGWTLASLLIIAFGLVTPNALGTAFIIAQAAAVALLAWLEYAVLRGTQAPGRA